MPTTVQFRRGTTAQNNSFTGASGELSVDTTLNVIRVHDGATAGGNALVGATTVQTLTNKTLTSPTITGTGTAIFASESIGGNSTVNGLTVNNSATIGTTLGVTGNVTGNYFFGNGSQLTGIDATSIQNGTSNVRVISSGGTVNMSIGGTSNIAIFTTTGEYVTGVVSATGNVTGAALTANGTATVGSTLGVTGAITGASTLTITGVSNLSGNVNTNHIMPFGNANANIGSTALQFNTVFAKATSAQYADLAENYTGDAEYLPGTVVVFGGAYEITTTEESHDTRVAGVVSTNPAYLMNSGSVGVPVALTGRVPCFVKGPVYKGDVLVTSTIPGVAEKIDHSLYKPGSILGKTLEENLSEETKLITVVVGRF